MTARDRLRSVRGVLAAGVVLRALAWGAGATLTIVAAVALIDQRAALAVQTRQTLIVVAVAGGIAVAAALLWRDRNVRSLGRVALWIEEREPSLEYRLVTAIETGIDTLVPANATARWRAVAGRQALRAALVPVVVVALLLLVFLVLPEGAVARIRDPRPGDALARGGPRTRGGGSRLAPLVAEVTPPRYSGERGIVVDEPMDVRALRGSVVTLRGRGEETGILGVAGTDTLRAERAGDQWRMDVRLGEKAVALRLLDGGAQRIVALEPIADAAPAVTIVSPARDSVLRVPKGRIPLAADVTDDFGIAAASFEFIVSSGEGESFTFKSGTLGAVNNPGRRASLRSSLPIDSLALKPGDIVHVRAVARDANDVSGPGLGASETRAIRIARADEYDSVSVDAAPPADAEKSVLSQRMLIMLAEALQQKRPSLRRDAVVAESRTIAADQKKLRRSVGEIVFTRLGGDPSGEEHTDDDPPARARTMEELLARADSATNAAPGITDFEGGESPVVAVNKPLLEAYNAMWDATGELEVGEPGRALPHMRRALAAIQRARQAERLYLRGRPPQVVVDVAKARLQGKDKGSSSTRRAPLAADSSARARDARFVTIVELAARNASAAADSLLLLRIDALADQPAFAAALGDAAAAIRAGKSTDAANALARARRVLGGAPVSRDSLSRWGTIP